MNLSRRKLYAIGEPFGDSATVRGVGRKTIYGMGGTGGTTSSAASTATTTTNTDSRVVGGNNSINLSSSGSTTTINNTDSGSVAAAFGFAKDVSANAFNYAQASQIDTSKTVSDAMGQVAAAYSTSKAGEQKVFAGAALAIVGVVAFIGLKAKG